MTSLDIISVVVGGARFTGWESVGVRRAFHEASRSFTLRAAAETGASALHQLFAVGAQVQIYFAGDLILTGDVTRRSPHLTATSCEVEIEGRSKTHHAVDSSAVHKTGHFENQDPVAIGNSLLSPLGLTLKSSLSQTPEPIYQLTPGETIFRALDRLARKRGMTLHDDAQGNLHMTNASVSRGKHAGGLIEGQNMVTASADHNGGNRHSHIIVRGQQSRLTGPQALQIEAIARDNNVAAYRPLVVIQDDETSLDQAKGRAQNHRSRAAGHSLKASVRVVGTRDAAGTIWEPGWLVWTQSDALDIAQDMLVESADTSQDEGGTLTELTLVDPRAYQGKGGRGAKSGAAWGQGSDPASGDIGAQ